MTVRGAFSQSVNVLGTSKVTISTATTTNFDFGTPNDLDLSEIAGYRPGDRVGAILSASSAGSTDDCTFVVQDADDAAGSIGTPAAADVNVADSGALAGGTGDNMIMVDVELQAGRPWLRFAVTSDGTTDTFVCHAVVFSIPRANV